MIEDLDDCPGLFSHSVASIIQGTEKIMGDFRDLPLLPEAPATARITTWQSTRYSGLIWKSTIMLGFSLFFWGYRIAAVSNDCAPAGWPDTDAIYAEMLPVTCWQRTSYRCSVIFRAGICRARCAKASYTGS